MRWVAYLLAVPVLFVLGTARSLQDHPVSHELPSAVVQVPVTSTPIVRAAAVVPQPTLAPDTGDTSRLQRLVDAARTWLGTPYGWGGCTRSGIDCSCLMQHAYAAIGINVPRTTVTQIAAYVPVPRDQLRVGDSLFFDDTCSNCGANPTHVGMWIGGGLMLDAGDPVKIEPVYWNKFRAAGRPIGL